MPPLPRRAFLGAELVSDDEALSPNGARISAIADGGMADRAGMQAGDTLLSLAGQPVRSFAELAAALRRAGAGPTAELQYLRGADVLSGSAAIVPAPHEELEGAGLAYGELTAGAIRLRTIATRLPAPRGVILALPSLACESVEAESPLASLAHAWARAGFETLRFDPRGLGDSEGGPCGETALDTELADCALALAAARARAEERGVPLVVFGQGTGALAAASLAAREPTRVDGVIAYGAAHRRWLATLGDAERRHLAAAGATAEAIEPAVASLVETARTAGLGGRSAAYHAALDAIDPAALWSKVRARALLVRGALDAFATAEDQDALAAAITGATASVTELAGLDHLLDESVPGSLASLVRATASWIGRG